MFGKITKKCLVMLALLSLTVALSAANGSTTIISSPAATVNLIRNHAITNEEVDREVENYRRAGMNLSRVQVLDILINDEVFLQGAERDGVVVNDMQVQQQLELASVVAEQLLVEVGVFRVGGHAEQPLGKLQHVVRVACFGAVDARAVRTGASQRALRHGLLPGEAEND